MAIKGNSAHINRRVGMTRVTGKLPPQRAVATWVGGPNTYLVEGAVRSDGVFGGLLIFA